MKIESLISKLYHQRFLKRVFPTLVFCLQEALKDCDSVLDLGCGPSSPLKHCKNITYSVGVDAFLPYIEKAKKQRIHSKYIRQELKAVEFPAKSFDAVILIEVLEHLPETEGRLLLKKAAKWARKKVIVSSPNGFVAQREVDSNPWQKHQSGWGFGKMRQLGFTSKGLAGIKFLRQEVQSDTMGDDITSSIRLRPRLFWWGVAALSQMITYRLAFLAFELFSVKKVSK